MANATATVTEIRNGHARTYGRRYHYRKPALPNLRVGPDVEVTVVPTGLDHRIDRMGRGYAWCRGQVLDAGRLQTRTMMIHGETYQTARHLLGIGASIVLIAHRQRVVDRDTGQAGAEIFRATNVVAVHDRHGREICGATGRVVEGHMRKGHYRTQRYGPGNSLTKIIRIEATAVNGGPAARLAA